MSYQKICVDNTTCSRRFHLSFDDAAAPQPQVEVRCLHCGVVVFARENHPQVKLLREENLVATTSLSPLRVRDCQFKDRFSPAPVAKE